jgi:hypothetical protein
MKPETLEQRWQQHVRDGGKLTLEQFTARTKRRQKGNRDRRALEGIPRKELAKLAGEIFDDLPDGAFFAAAQDTFGLDPEDFLD